MLRRSALLSLALPLALFAQTDPAPKPLRVLFIGNSYTFYNNLPKLLESIAASQKTGPRIETQASLSGGKTLEWHWNHKEAVEAIRKGGWDYVVIQEYSTLGRLVPAGGQPSINDPELYFEYARRFHDEIARTGAKTLLYATWARAGFPEHQRRLDDAFTRFARESGAGIVPAGLAWTITQLEYPALRLHSPDRSHPTAAGSYLNALLFYQCLTGRPANEPPTVITGPRRFDDPTPATLVNLSWGDANTLNQIAQRAVAAEPLIPSR